eukprot:CAMPEP_0113309094 /NCGR_PEP_ID=MMETSP0010_2-20120614/7279_1 /TAXON_ID=216773 ORGANISM="Corethron hystrix, Strain 308" /NCGR_SAMPLE_ID=MMETSP0010_2 /ASSEMBLY_ACC=CAM_ASM_000155 /LENGTH=307 /DNA_ID=CAMNT_0000164285 /DNA_START=75 /DNA_END=998 /DNA_ORIENTATION=- /assembly_acc=CAM_ASM_000155
MTKFGVVVAVASTFAVVNAKASHSSAFITASYRSKQAPNTKSLVILDARRETSVDASTATFATAAVSAAFVLGSFPGICYADSGPESLSAIIGLGFFLGAAATIARAVVVEDVESKEDPDKIGKTVPSLADEEAAVSEAAEEIENTQDEIKATEEAEAAIEEVVEEVKEVVEEPKTKVEEVKEVAEEAETAVEEVEIKMEEVETEIEEADSKSEFADQTPAPKMPQPTKIDEAKKRVASTLEGETAKIQQMVEKTKDEKIAEAITNKNDAPFTEDIVESSIKPGKPVKIGIFRRIGQLAKRVIFFWR